MGLESTSVISGLNSSWPLGTDDASTADDHIRLVKAVMKADALAIENNLSDLGTPATARTNLGLGDCATLDVGTGAGEVAAGDHNHDSDYVAAGGPSIQIFTSSATWTRPSGCKMIKVTVTGGGGGGAGGDGVGSFQPPGGGGGAGATAIEYIDVSAVPTVAVTVGTGGAGGAQDTDGSDGIDSTFGAYCTGGKGSGGNAYNDGGAAAHTNGGAGGAATGGDMNIPGGGGDSNWDLDDYGHGGKGGASFWGGSAYMRRGAAPVASTAYGAGGCGGGRAYSGGAGAPGVVMVEEYY